MGCDIAQGFYLSRPLTTQDATSAVAVLLDLQEVVVLARHRAALASDFVAKDDLVLGDVVNTRALLAVGRDLTDRPLNPAPVLTSRDNLANANNSLARGRQPKKATELDRLGKLRQIRRN